MIIIRFAVTIFLNAKKSATVHKFDAIDVKEVRYNIDATQTEFASTFGIGLGILRHWERGDRTPRYALFSPCNLNLKMSYT